MTIAENLASLNAAISEACRRAGRAGNDVTLIAASKTWDEPVVRQALEAGHRLFGENRVQEAVAKWPALKAIFPDVRVHLIGHLQTNKVAEAVSCFDLIHTVDRPKLVRMIAGEQKKQKRQIECFIQVNTGEEPQKGGVAPGEAAGLVASARAAGLIVTGLMCIPPADQEPAPHFALLARLARDVEVDYLSMGMSADFAVAIEQGATHVRVGSAIFGRRGGTAP